MSTGDADLAEDCRRRFAVKNGLACVYQDASLRFRIVREVRSDHFKHRRFRECPCLYEGQVGHWSVSLNKFSHKKFWSLDQLKANEIEK